LIFLYVLLSLLSFPLLASISLRVSWEPGVFGLLGRNGAGKTTLLQILATLLPATQGTVHMGPYEVQKDRWKIRRDLGLGFLPQEQGYYPKLTVKETLIYLSVLQGIKERKNRLIVFWKK
jgi:ABC-2 type transport system ATP-binding protein